MNLREYLLILNKKKATIISIILIFMIIGAVFTLTQPLKYKASSTALVIEKFETGIHRYNAMKANEYLSGILARVIGSNSFFNEVIDSGFNINGGYFTDSPVKQANKWKNTVYANPVGDAGMIEINVYHPDKYQLEQIVRAVNYTLKLKHGEYHGGGDSVGIEIINKPVYSSLPAKPDIPFNLAAAFLLGIIASLFYAYLFPEEKYNIRLWPKRLARNRIDNFKNNRAARKASRKGFKPEPITNSITDVQEYAPATADIATDKSLELNDDIMNYQDIIKQGSMQNVLGN